MADDKADSSLDLLRDEYKILQDKIDKIGAFRFTIRGWSVTAVIGGFLAGSGVRTLSTHLISISVSLSLAFFLFFEKQQVVLSNKFGARAERVEELIKNHEGDAFVGPLITATVIRKRERAISWYTFVLPKYFRKKMLKLKKRLTVWLEANAVFYIVLMLLSFSPELFPKAQATERWLSDEIVKIRTVFYAPKSRPDTHPSSKSSAKVPNI